MSNIEIIAGVVVGLLLFLLLQGVDLWPVLFVAGLAAAFFFISRNMSSNRKTFLAFGGEGIPAVSFDDIGGQESAKTELCEALEFIKDTDKLSALGIRPLKGILLSGPPGTGKTLLAKAAAQFSDSVFVTASGSEFVEMYVGVGAERIRKLFKQARLLATKAGKASAVIFIDEIEVLGGKRGQANSHLEHEQTLNELLVQMDGLTEELSVRLLLIGATNRSDMLDPALMRPGRFDRVVKVDLPDKIGRLTILKLHTRNKPLASGVSLDDIASGTFGFSGAHLESVANEAAILALREGKSEISLQHLQSSIDKVIMGEKLDRIPHQGEKRRIAIHEAGHAILGELVTPGSVASVNVASRSNALGYVRQTQEDFYLYTKDHLQARITLALAGAAAEGILLDSRSTGAANDFKQAADLAKQIIYGGMSKLGIVSPEDIPQEILHETITGVLQEAENHTIKILQARKDMLSQIAAALLDKETLSGNELRAILAEPPISAIEMPQ